MYRANLDKVAGAKKVLEIGFGNGKQLQLLFERYPDMELYGIDISEDMLIAARERLGNAASLVVADAENIPFEADYFDAVITTDTCYFWNNTHKVFSEINRVLKREGIFVNSLNTVYARYADKTYKDECASDTDILIKFSKGTSFDVSSKEKLGGNEEQVVFIKQ
ncbi:MAG: class I SAM-dependent methyltransferase [Pseudobutyrivibrio sp.]|nr:class I SAM-dependent methyltransferase [Pseudobutyrivibrio sp.]